MYKLPADSGHMLSHNRVPISALKSSPLHVNDGALAALHNMRRSFGSVTLAAPCTWNLSGLLQPHVRPLTPLPR